MCVQGAQATGRLPTLIDCSVTDATPGTLGAALTRFAHLAGVSLSLDPALVTGRQSRGLSGSYSVDEGFMQLLQGSGLQLQPVGNGAFTLVPVAQASDALEIARRTKRVIGQNLRYSLVYNLLALPLAAAGMIPPWLAEIGMTASSLVVIFNTLRLMD